jgi:molecular chaperone GrpE
MRFDPREHEAVANVPGTGRPGGEIVDELRRGYRLRDRVIRPALVAVAEDAATGEMDESTEINRRIN